MSTVPERPSHPIFRVLDRQPADPLLAVIGMHRSDQRAHKIDLGVGVYRDDTGATPVMRAVKAAEKRLLSEQETKSYLGAEGDQVFTDTLAEVVFGSALAREQRLTGIQTPGGTGALRLAAELLARAGSPTVWIGVPTWPNHAPIFREARLAVRQHAYFDASRSAIDVDAMVDGLAEARPGDVVLLHGCCHNPTGTAFSPTEWQDVIELIAVRGLIPLIDLAYQGLGQGLDEDASGMRAALSAVPEALVAYSCDKNFALYRERVGALWVQTGGLAEASPVHETLLILARGLWSMPPDHGAAIVRTILQDPALDAEWRSELTSMCGRVNALRSSLGASHPALAPIAGQQGLFALLPIDDVAVDDLRNRHAIYMPASGRINIAGLRDDLIERFIAAVTPYLPIR